MPKTPRLIQINDGPGGKAKNDLCLRSLNVEKGSQRVGKSIHHAFVPLLTIPCIVP